MLSIGMLSVTPRFSEVQKQQRLAPTASAVSKQAARPLKDWETAEAVPIGFARTTPS
ncbi:MAG TPA: hypothetical protein VL361_11590 [Candidatus Limnocylindrales bacterium]|nr:hypothetical protein [Candidatus Limnocylindrales bacterium]